MHHRYLSILVSIAAMGATPMIAAAEAEAPA